MNPRTYIRRRRRSIAALRTLLPVGRSLLPGVPGVRLVSSASPRLAAARLRAVLLRGLKRRQQSVELALEAGQVGLHRRGRLLAPFFSYVPRWLVPVGIPLERFFLSFMHT